MRIFFLCVKLNASAVPCVDVLREEEEEEEEEEEDTSFDPTCTIHHISDTKLDIKQCKHTS